MCNGTGKKGNSIHIGSFDQTNLTSPTLRLNQPLDDNNKEATYPARKNCWLTLQEERSSLSLSRAAITQLGCFLFPTALHPVHSFLHAVILLYDNNYCTNSPSCAPSPTNLPTHAIKNPLKTVSITILQSGPRAIHVPPIY